MQSNTVPLFSSALRSASLTATDTMTKTLRTTVVTKPESRAVLETVRCESKNAWSLTKTKPEKKSGASL
ncbi:MAG: hypothetical protein RLZZ156_1983 [Deinococcota bacterium]